jgi:hypothetical protein
MNLPLAEIRISKSLQASALIMFFLISIAGNAQSLATIALSSSGTAKFNQPVTFTATVTPSTCTGTVTFSDTADVLGSAPLSSGSAGITVSTLSAGSHSIRAFYSGDANCQPSQSSPMTEDIAGADLVIAQQLFPQQPVMKITAVGGRMRILVTLTNNDVSLVNVTFSETLSGKGVITSAVPSQGSCSLGDMITCDIGSVASGQVITIDMTATPYFTRNLIATGSSNATVNTGISPAEVRLMPFVH